MAIACSEPVAEINSTTNASAYSFASFTPTAGALLVCMAFATGTVAAGTMSNSSGTSLRWTKLASVAYNGGVDTAYLYVAQVPTSTIASVYNVNTTGDAATGCFAVMFQFTGHNVFNPVRQVKTNSALATANPSLTFDTALDTNNGYALGFGIDRTAPASTPPSVSWTEIADGGYGTPAAGGTGAFRATGETGTAYSFTAASGDWGILGIEINEASVGAQPVDPMGVCGMFGI
jgi:hypothetical protein